MYYLCRKFYKPITIQGFPGGSSGKEPTCDFPGSSVGKASAWKQQNKTNKKQTRLQWGRPLFNSWGWKFPLEKG